MSPVDIAKSQSSVDSTLGTLLESIDRISRDTRNNILPAPNVLDTVRNTGQPSGILTGAETAGLKKKVHDLSLKGLIAGIRRDEEGNRAKERFFSPRDKNGNWDLNDQPPEFWGHYNSVIQTNSHLRVHPLLEWTEVDIWNYIKREEIPVVSLYFSKNGKRYRSLGDKDITNPISSEASNIDEIITELEKTRISERSGRAMDHEAEDAFERLRTDGYL